MEETIFTTVFSEYWLIGALFILTLLWVYKLWKFFISNYLNIIKEKHTLEIKAQESKDLEFLKSVWEISKIIRSWDDSHREEHRKLGDKIDNWHTNISWRLDKIEVLVSK